MARLLGMTRRGNGLRLTAAAVVAMAALWGISTASAAETRGAAPSAKGAEKTYRFVVSNNFLGNDWRPQVERLAQLTTNYPPFKGRVKVEIQNADNTVQAQIQSLNNIIQTKPDAILLIASSGTALNPTVARACAAKILVFTISSVITAPCAWNVSQSMFDGQKVVGRWMGKVLKNQGSIFVDRGITGLKDAQDIQDGFMAGLKETGSKVEVAGQFDGKFAAGPEQSGISSLLVANPDVSGVMTQGYCQPVFNALKAGGKGSVPATCYAYNGELTACAKSGRACAILSGSPIVIQIAMKAALDVLDGKPAPPKTKLIPVPMTVFVTKSPAVKVAGSGVKVEVMKAGKNFYPALPPGLALPWTLPQYPISAKAAAGK